MPQCVIEHDQRARARTHPRRDRRRAIGVAVAARPLRIEQGVAAVEGLAVGEVDHEGEVGAQVRPAMVHAVLVDVEALARTIAAQAQALVERMQAPARAVGIDQQLRRMLAQAFEQALRQRRIVEHLTVVVAVRRGIVAAGVEETARLRGRDVRGAFVRGQKTVDQRAASQRRGQRILAVQGRQGPAGPGGLKRVGCGVHEGTRVRRRTNGFARPRRYARCRPYSGPRGASSARRPARRAPAVPSRSRANPGRRRRRAARSRARVERHAAVASVHTTIGCFAHGAPRARSTVPLSQRASQFARAIGTRPCGGASGRSTTSENGSAIHELLGECAVTNNDLRVVE